LGAMQALRLAPLIAEDALRASLRLGRRYVAIVGPPGSTAVVTAEGAAEGWNSTVPPGGHFENRVAAANAVGLLWNSALRYAPMISAPLLVCVCDRETLIDPKYVELVGMRAPRGEARHYDSDHFEIYHPPLVAQALADQTAFLREHLDVRA
jgi:hypothetical protein